MKRIFYALAFSVAIVAYSCSYDDVEIGDPHIAYVIDESFNAFFIIGFESKGASDALFSASVSDGTFSWTSQCFRFEGDSRTFNCTSLMPIAFYDLESHELEIDISRNNSKTRKSAVMECPYALFVPSVIEETASGVSVETQGQDEHDADSLEALESLEPRAPGGLQANAQSAPPSQDFVELTFESREAIRNAIEGSSAVFGATVSRSSSSRLALRIDGYSVSREIFYGLLKNDGEIASSARIESRNTRVSVTDAVDRVVLVERIQMQGSRYPIYLMRILRF